MPGSWERITNQPDFEIFYTLLLTDGTVLCHAGGARWLKFIPDQYGEYREGTWAAVDSMHAARRWFSAAVLGDGRVLVAFGWSPLSSSPSRPQASIEIFDPVASRPGRWNLIPAPPGWEPVLVSAPQTHVCPLSDGYRVLVDNDIQTAPYSHRSVSALFNISSERWTVVPTSEEYGCGSTHGWALLSDGSILSTNCVPDQRFLPDTGIGGGRWISAGSANYLDPFAGMETPGLLLPDGRAWVVGQRSPETSFYTPSANREGIGVWTLGPRFPLDEWGFSPDVNQLAMCLLPSGVVLCCGRGRIDGMPSFFEFDSLRTDAPITAIHGPALTQEEFSEHVPYETAKLLLLLPTGQVLSVIRSKTTRTSHLFIYTPSRDMRDPHSSWRPSLISPISGSYLSPGQEYIASGTLLNGISQAVRHSGYENGNEATATNFPIVRLKHEESGLVWYCRTRNPSSMGVATGTTEHSTRFKIPSGVPNGAAELCVIANGIVGNCISVTIVPEIRAPLIWREVMQLIGNLADGPLFVLGPNGIRPVPPFGPDINEKAFRTEAIIAYKHIALGLLNLNSLSQVMEEKQADSFNETDLKQSSVLRDMQYGLSILRKLGDQLERSIKKL